jgi:2-succinyl-5-enolpyruvyl-6-hydroxy-3-cyclohexene-1-carboxylate synthase
VLVIINNDGGSIFHALPALQGREYFSEFFQTPHGTNFAGAAMQFNLNYEATKDISNFASLYKQACARDSSSIIEVFTTSQDASKSLKALIDNYKLRT